MIGHQFFPRVHHLWIRCMAHPKFCNFAKITEKMQNQCEKPQQRRRSKQKVDTYDTRHVTKRKTGVKVWNLYSFWLERDTTSIVLSGWSRHYVLQFKDNTWNVIIIISTQVIAQGYVSENKESRRTKYCKDTLYSNCFICNLSSYLAFALRVVIDKESNKACIMPQLA